MKSITKIKCLPSGAFEMYMEREGPTHWVDEVRIILPGQNIVFTFNKKNWLLMLKMKMKHV